MPFEPVSPLGGFTGTPTAPERAPVPSADDSVWGAAFRTENIVGSSIASEEVRTAREQGGIGAFGGGAVRIDPDFDPWAEIADTPYESYTDQFAVAGNKDHFEAIKADIDRETKDRETIHKSGWTGIGASMAAGVLDLPILLPGGNIIRSAKGGVSLLRTAGSTAAYGTLAAAASETVLQGSQELRTGTESAVVIGGSTVLAGLLGAGFGKLFSRADQAAHAARIEQDFYVPGRGEPDPFTPGSVQVGAAPGASAKAASVADIIRQTAEEILPPGVRVQVADEIAIGDGGQYGLRAFHSSQADFDSFSRSYSGTGQGQRMNGPGLYVGSTGEVARYYGRLLAKQKGLLSSVARNVLNEVDGDVEKAFALIADKKKIYKPGAALDSLVAAEKELINKVPGYVYDVSLRTNSESILDGNKLLHEQAIGADVLNLIGKYDKSIAEADSFSKLDKIQDYDPFRNETGEFIGPDLARDLTGEQALALLRMKGMSNDDLTKAGLHGMLFTEGDLAKKGGRSYVIFDPALATIEGRSEGLFGVRQGIDGLTAEGRFDPEQLLITISANALDPVKTLKHETIHALRKMKLFTDAEWGTLEAAARSQGWVESNNVRALYEGVYSGRGVTPAAQAPFNVPGFRGEFKDLGMLDGGYLRREYFLYGADGKVAGKMEVRQEAGGSGFIYDVEAPGIGAKFYDAVEKHFGVKLRPSGALTEAGLKFWKKRDPDAVKWHQLSEEIDEKYLSPSEIRKNLDELPASFRHEINELQELWSRLPEDGKASAALPSSGRGTSVGAAARDPKLETLLIEEAIAEQFSLWRNGAITVAGTVAKLFQRMKDFLDRVGNALRGRGFQNADDVFASVRGGDVAGRATPAGRSIPAGAPLAAGSGRATSVGAAGRDVVDNTLKPALGLETVRIDPLIYLQNSKSDKTKAYIQELAETPLAYKKNAEGFETAPLGSEMGEPGAVESRIKGWQAPLAESIQFTENAFMRYRKGRDKKPLDIMRATISDAISTPEKLTWRQFKEEVSRAMRRGDEHEIPEVAEAAKFVRKTLFDPLKDRAIGKELLPEDISVETAESYLNRLYNKEKIIARRPEFKEIVTKWLDEVEFRNGVTRRQLTPLLDEVERMKGNQKKLEPRIAQREKRLKELETAAEEVAKFNKFAFERALKGSEKVAQSRQAFTDQATKLADRFEAPLETLREIKGFAADVAEVRKFARQVREAESQDESFILLVEDLMQIEERIPALIAKGDAELERLGKVEPAPTSAAPKNALTALRELSAELSEAIKPYKKQFKTAATKLRGAEGREGAKASERGAFSTVIRRRGNTLADQVSGRRAELDTMRADLALRNERITDSQKQIEALVLKYEGKTKAEAESAVKAREKAEAERDPTAKRLTSADKPIIRAAKKIIERTDKEPGETASLADEIIDRILGTPDGRLPYDAHLTKTTSPQGVSSSARGPLAGREFMIPDEMIEDFLENDFEMLMHAYVRTMAPDVELHARFGDVDMKLQFKEIQDDWARKAAAATSEKERRSLHAQRDGDIRRLAAIRDRLRGTYALPSNPDGLLLRTGRVMRSLNYVAMLGGQSVSAIPDMGSVVFSHGIMRTFGDGIIPLFRNFSGTRLAAREVKLAGTALDMVLDSRAMNIGEILDDFGRHTKFERGVQSMTRSFGPVSLMSPWNAALKQFAGLITISRILRASDALVRGKIKKPDIERLAASGISENNARKIAEQFKKHGTKEGGVWLPNTENWDKEARAAKEAFRVALVREVDKTIITPGQEKYLWLSTELGKTLGQFKSFSVSANQRLLIAGLQQRDMGTLSGAALMVALGGLVHILKTKAGGREPDIDWGDGEKTSQFMVNAVDRSGLLGALMEMNAMSEKLTGGQVGLSKLTGRPVSRYASRNVVGAMAGPTFGTLQSIGQVSSAGFTKWSESDTRAARRLIPYQNLLYMRHLFDKAESGVNDFFGVPKTATRH